MTLKHQAITGVKWNTLTTLLSTIFQLVSYIVLARILQPADFGLMAMATVIIGFAQSFSDAGISSAIIYRQDATTDQLSSLFWLNIWTGILVFVLIVCLEPLILLLFSEPRLPSILYTVALTFLIIPWGKQFEILLQKDLNFAVLSKIQIVALTISTAVTVCTALLGYGVWSLVWGQLSLAILSTFMLALVGYRWYRPQIHFKRNDLKGYLNFGLFQMGERCVNFFAERFDQLILASLLGAQGLGYYNFAFNIINIPLSRINPIINKVIFPVFAQIQDNALHLKAGYLKVLRLLISVNAPLLIGIAIVSPLAIPLIFGTKWTASVIILQILSIVALSRSIGNPVGSLILAKGRAELGFKWNLGLTMIQIPALYIGAKLGGAMGVALALALVQILLSIFNYLVLIRTLLGPCLREYIQSLWPALWMSGIMAMTASAINILFQTVSQPVTLIAQLLCGALVYLSLFFCFQKDLFNEIQAMLFKGGIAIEKK